MHFYGYARVSTTGQDLTIQREALKAAGCKVIREEKVSGTSRQGRAEPDTRHQFIRSGDTYAGTRIDRRSRGIKTPVGIKVGGPDLLELERIGKEIEDVIRNVPGTLSVYAERVMGGSYLDFTIDRDAIARYGLTGGDLQGLLEAAMGGLTMPPARSGVCVNPLRSASNCAAVGATLRPVSENSAYTAIALSTPPVVSIVGDVSSDQPPTNVNDRSSSVPVF